MIYRNQLLARQRAGHPGRPLLDRTWPGARRLVAFWPMTDRSGLKVTDVSGLGGTADMVNAPTWSSTGPIGSSIVLNGTNQYALPSASRAFIDAVQSSASISVSSWINIGTASMSIGRMVDTDNGVGGAKVFGLIIVSNKAYFYADTYPTPSDFVTGGPNLNDGAWHHVVGIRDATRTVMSLFVDGVLVSTLSSFAWTGNFSIIPSVILGARFTRDSGWFAGRLGPQAIWNRPLVTGEPLSLYRNPTAGLLWPDDWLVGQRGPSDPFTWSPMTPGQHQPVISRPVMIPSG